MLKLLLFLVWISSFWQFGLSHKFGAFRLFCFHVPPVVVFVRIFIGIFDLIGRSLDLSWLGRVLANFVDFIDLIIKLVIHWPGFYGFAAWTDFLLFFGDLCNSLRLDNLIISESKRINWLLNHGVNLLGCYRLLWSPIGRRIFSIGVTSPLLGKHIHSNQESCLVITIVKIVDYDNPVKRICCVYISCP